MESLNGVSSRNIFARCSGEDFSNVEWLRKELLHLTCTINSLLILRRQLVETKNRDDVLQVLVALQHVLHTTRTLIVLFANDRWVEGVGDRSERIHRRIDTKLSDRTLENDSGVQVSEGIGWRRVSQIIRRDVNSLERSNRTLLSRGNTLLKVTHFLRKCWLVTHRRW